MVDIHELEKHSTELVTDEFHLLERNCTVLSQEEDKMITYTFFKSKPMRQLSTPG